MEIESQIESLIFVSEEAITLEDMQLYLQDYLEKPVDISDIEAAVGHIENRHASSNSGLRLVKISGGFRILSKPDNREFLSSYLIKRNARKLSRSSLETLAIIAYKQPITRAEVDRIRGVNSDYSIQKLMEKDLIQIEGRSEGPGRPLIYKTSERFMDHFGLSSLDALPQLENIEEVKPKLDL